jgi:hypothetical protein
MRRTGTFFSFLHPLEFVLGLLGSSTWSFEGTDIDQSDTDVVSYGGVGLHVSGTARLDWTFF